MIGQWEEVPGTALAPVVGPPPPGVPASSWWNPINIVFDYNGACLDQLRLEVVKPACGGHAGWPGNSAFAIPLTGGPARRLTDPSVYPLTTAGTTDVLADGRPASRHTYDNQIYLPDQDAVFLVGGSLWKSGTWGRTSWFFHRQTNQWERRADCPHSGVFQLDWDPVLKLVVARSGNGGTIVTYNPVTNGWTWRKGGLGGTASERTGVLVPEDRKFYYVGWTYGTPSENNLLRTVDLNTWSHSVQTTTGATAMCAVRGPGLCYVPPSAPDGPFRDKIVSYMGGRDFYILDRVSRVWSIFTVTEGIVPPVAPWPGLFKQFGYVPALQAFYALLDLNRNIFLYRLAEPLSYNTPGTPTVTVG